MFGNMKKIGIVIIATNAYFILGLRFIEKFMRHYKGGYKITFYFFSDEDPSYYTSLNNIKYIHKKDKSWVDATNSKFSSIINTNFDEDYVFYFDADTNVDKDFTEEWFIGELVSGEHFGNKTFLSNGKGFDRNPKSKAYVPKDSELPYTYRYGAFFGGSVNNMKEMCKVLKGWQIEDKKINYEPGSNDESYLNKYFHFNPSITVPCEKFAFLISDKGGLLNTRNTSQDISKLKKEILKNKDRNWDIKNNKIITYD